MKKILLLLLLIPTIVLSQWRFQTDNDPFEGKTSYGFVAGTGGDFPYENPQLVFRKRDGNIDVYIQDVGYVTGGYLEFSFGDPNEILSFELSPSTTKESGFLNLISISAFDNTINVISKESSPYELGYQSEKIINDSNSFLELLDKLKAGSIAYVRYRDSGQANRFRISLSNSTNVINQVLGDYTEKLKLKLNEYQLKLDAIFKEKQEEEQKEVNKEGKYYDLLRQLPELEYGISKTSFSILNYRMADIDSLTYKKESWCYIDVFVWYKGKPTPVKIRGGARKLAVCE
jgi:hypothetical protein